MTVSYDSKAKSKINPRFANLDHTREDELAWAQELADREAAAREYDRMIDERYRRVRLAERACKGAML